MVLSEIISYFCSLFSALNVLIYYMQPFFDYFLQFPAYLTILLGIFIIAFFIQIYYWFSYASVSVHRQRRDKTEDKDHLRDGVSIVFLIKDQFDFLDSGLSLIMDQDYPAMEVVAVNDCGGSDMDDALEQKAAIYPNFRFTTLKADDNFNHSRKIPILVGIKAARYEKIMLVDTNARPSSNRWLEFMVRGLQDNSMVLGYTAIEQGKGLLNRWIRAAYFTRSMRFLHAATHGRPYRGIYNNMGYTKALFFGNKGFTHLNMNCGEDDLFVQKVARSSTRIGVVINPHCKMIQRQPALGWVKWWNFSRLWSFPFKMYPTRAKVYTFVELFSRFVLFSITVAISVLAMPSAISWVVLGLFVVRELCMMRSVSRICKRLGEAKIKGFYLLYDLLCPLSEAVVCLSRRMVKVGGLYVTTIK